MKLYIYEHCPFCARVRFIGRKLGINFEEVIVGYNDDRTLTDLVGKRTVPILMTEDNASFADSKNIIDHFLTLAKSNSHREPEYPTIAWQSRGFPLLQRIGYPRWHLLNLGEFSNEQSRKLWIARKETPSLNFDRLLEQTESIVKQVDVLLLEAEKLLQLSGSRSGKSLLDQSIFFSLLRGFYSEPTLKWPNSLEIWMQEQSQTLNIPLLR